MGLEVGFAIFVKHRFWKDHCTFHGGSHVKTG